MRELLSLIHTILTIIILLKIKLTLIQTTGMTKKILCVGREKILRFIDRRRCSVLSLLVFQLFFKLDRILQGFIQIAAIIKIKIYIHVLSIITF